MCLSLITAIIFSKLLRLTALSLKLLLFTILLKLWCDLSKFLRCATSSTSKESIDFLFPLTKYSLSWLPHKNVILRIMRNAAMASTNCRLFLLLNRILKINNIFDVIFQLYPWHITITILTFTNHKLVSENTLSFATTHDEILIETVLTVLTFTNYTFGLFNELWRRWK